MSKKSTKLMTRDQMIESIQNTCHKTQIVVGLSLSNT